MLQGFKERLDIRTLVVTGTVAILMIVAAALTQAALGVGTPCAFAQASECPPEGIDNLVPKDLTISAGSLAFTNSLIFVKPEACTDDILDIVTGAVTGDYLILMLDHDACTPLKKVTINNNPGTTDGFSLRGGQGFILDSNYDSITLVKRVGSNFWVEVSRTDNTLEHVGVRAYNNANITIPNATWTTLTFNSERFDSGNLHNTATNTSRLTATSSGVYVITSNILVSVNGSGFRVANINVNGTFSIASMRLPAFSGDMVGMSFTTTYYLNQNDYVELLVYQNSGSSLTAVATGVGNSSPEFSMVKVGN